MISVEQIHIIVAELSIESIVKSEEREVAGDIVESAMYTGKAMACNEILKKLIEMEKASEDA